MLSIKRLLCLLLLIAPLGAQAQFFSSSGQSDFLPVLEAFESQAWHDGERVYVGVDIADGYYLYRHQLDLEGNGLESLQIPQGEAHTDEFMGEAQVFRHQLVFQAPLVEAHDGPMSLEFRFQGCADAGLCYPPEQITLEAAQTTAPPAFADALAESDTAAPIDTPVDFGAVQSEDGHFSALISEASLPLALGLFLLAGIGLTFTPCVLPMLPILSSIIVGQNPSRPRAFMLSLSYVLGMAMTYALVGVLMGLFGAGLNLQARLQSPPVLIGFAALFSLFAVAMLGAFNLSLSPKLANRVERWQSRAQQSGPMGLALAGALSVLVVSPCVTAPLAGALVFISSTGDALMGAAVLFTLGLGMGLPLLLVGTFGTTLLPRSGAWMNGVKTAFGLLLFGVAIWMVERLIAPPLALLLWAALAISTALTLGALARAADGWARARQTLGLMLLVWGGALVLGAAGGGGDPLRPLDHAASSFSPGQSLEARAFESVEGLDGLNEALSRSDERLAFVHFTADWCISCKLMERDVYPDPRVIDALKDMALIEVDVTQTTPNTRAALEAFDLFGPPSLLFFDGGREIRQARIQGEVDAKALAEHLSSLKRALNTRPSA
ncbi:protein-disulfide reductase DsbD [Halomonas sp. PAMB 3232]|uniref:protein-disulfide reductase DsbD n=1 Tax=Halomonas sp. PAMB 3232 TaxID=3075221 RepID=UPI00289BC489|nr:protein-disulfide reductase DsbD [Halomonas sp. PAMB 3232]WNL37377.1 protein-disulfide reductase DsbD [Halomonas sp. PAMB 3232]